MCFCFFDIFVDTHYAAPIWRLHINWTFGGSYSFVLYIFDHAITVEDNNDEEFRIIPIVITMVRLHCYKNITTELK